MQVRAIQGDTIDLVCWRHLGMTGGGLVEAALELNPGLAAGVQLQAGQLVILPAMPAANTTTKGVIQLWD
jgi:phage tail protein X